MALTVLHVPNSLDREVFDAETRQGDPGAAALRALPALLRGLKSETRYP